MPTFGPTELILVLAIVVIIFGVGKLPEVGGALGKSIREFRKASNDEPDPKASSANPPSSSVAADAPATSSPNVTEPASSEKDRAV